MEGGSEEKPRPHPEKTTITEAADRGSHRGRAAM